MAPVVEASGGGAFLIRSLNPDDLFTPEDLSDEQRLFGRTAAEFMRPIPSSKPSVRPLST